MSDAPFQNPAHVKDRFQAVLLAVMMGDAMGQPVETMTRAEIITATGGAGIKFFSDSLQTKIQENRKLMAGDTTDDWQQTKLVAQSLSGYDGFCLEDIAREHTMLFREAIVLCDDVDEYDPKAVQKWLAWLKANPDNPYSETVGWGGTTLRAVAELYQGFATNFELGRHFDTPAPNYGKGRGGGNCAAMKLSPLVLMHWAKQSSPENMLRDVIRLFTLTHSSPDALKATVYYALALYQVLSDPELSDDPKAFLSFAQSRFLLSPSEDAELFRECKLTRKAFGELLRASRLGKRAFADTYRLVRPNFYAPESIAYSIGNFLGHGHSTVETILQAVNDGLDSDTTAVMSGALAAAANGLDSLPLSWFTFDTTGFRAAVDLGEELAASCGIFT